MIKEALATLSTGQDLDRETMIAVMNEIMEGLGTTAQIGAFLMGLRLKGETVDEITGAAVVMRAKAKKISAPGPCLDTCGTGGDHSGTFNISTTAAFIAAGAGLTVAKHGNRAATSSCGSADVLAALGVNIEAGPETVERCLAEAGIGFLFAPTLHAAMRHAIGPRRELGIRTIFNVLGPLTNPAGASRQLLGVFSPGLTAPLASTLKNLGSEAAMVVHGLDGLDEITLTASTQVSELRDGEVRTYQLAPSKLGLALCRRQDLLGGDPAANARILRDVLDGVPGPALEISVLNAGAAIYAGGRAATVIEGIGRAREAVASGEARRRLERLIAVSKE